MSHIEKGEGFIEEDKTRKSTTWVDFTAIVDFCFREKKREKEREELWKRLTELEVNNKNFICCYLCEKKKRVSFPDLKNKKKSEWREQARSAWRVALQLVRDKRPCVRKGTAVLLFTRWCAKLRKVELKVEDQISFCFDFDKL
uniref:Uncharacterized protein n=1 Tax=Timema genevievae TaxID=629358 RepID=A0A7R9JTP7_TIMGE|nr:unnamed protein product [Timema genevievae]